MSCQLPIDCLNDILEHLRDDKDEDTLRSCLLVNRLWCKVSVPILWTNIQNYDTLITCLPKESKEILYKNGIIISTPTLKSPLFNYVTFIKCVSIDEINRKIIQYFLKKHQHIIDNNKCIVVAQELFKMFMNKTSLKYLNFYRDIFNIPFTTYPGATDCLRNLSELRCNSNISSEFFYQLSQTCHNI